MNDTKQFDVHGISLEGCHLVEASAGTGKTYSLALLVLRQLLEAKLPVRRVLMVTFTNAAVAELEKRVRHFIRQAYQAVHDSSVDHSIQRVVATALDLHGPEQTVFLLKRAQASLDELSVYTIDAFCKRMLDEFAFETNQLFSANLTTDADAFLQKVYYRCWRALISQQPAALWAAAGLAEAFGYAQFKEVVMKVREGKIFLGLTEPADPDTAAQLFRCAAALQNTETVKEAHWAEMQAYFTTHQSAIRAYGSKGRAKRSFANACDNWEDFAATLKGKNTDYISDNEDFAWLSERLNQYHTLQENAVTAYQQAVLLHAAAIALPWLNEELKARKTMLFSDLIDSLHTVLKGEDREAALRLHHSIRERYQAVFIDEFQDTSQRQYEVFYELFSKDKALYFIGDPKQSIYAFRQADIFTYLEARSLCQVHVMNTNYRSSRRCVEALNRFYLPTAGFDTFGFGKEGNQAARIDYLPVDFPEGKADMELIGPDGQPATAIELWTGEVKEQCVHQAALAVYDLLTQPYQLQKGDFLRPVQPSDIGVLVRSRSEGQSIKAALAQRGIPAVFVNDQKVLLSREAEMMALLLEAMWSPDTPRIHRALLHGFARHSVPELLATDPNLLLEKFRRYQGLLRNEAKGIYPAIAAFVADFDVLSVQLDTTPRDERSVTNLYQLAELLHKTARRRQLSPEELVSWLRKVKERGGEDLSGPGLVADEFTQRMESDEAAVRIATIHTSKGLEYNIVVALGLDMRPPNSRKDHVVSWCRPATESGNAAYYFAPFTRLTKDSSDHLLLTGQEKQENLRLLYVALTRTVYKCFVFRYESKNNKGNTMLRPFVDALQPGCVHIAHGETCTVFSQDGGFYTPPVHQQQIIPLPALPAGEPVWKLYSYSSLKQKEKLPFTVASGLAATDYDRFVFTELPRGKEHGVLFHTLMERIDFSNENRWEKGLKLFPVTLWEGYLQLLKTLVKTPIRVPGEATVRLNMVTIAERLNEVQFHLPLNGADGQRLQALSEPQQGWQLQLALTQTRLEGMLEGVVDLFFEQDGRYYILDWKTDYLGDNLSDYSSAAIEQAMTRRHYHLQGLLYTVAMHLYLQQRLPGYRYSKHFGGFIYVFVRGMRTGGDTGYYSRCLPEAMVEEAVEILCGVEA